MSKAFICKIIVIRNFASRFSVQWLRKVFEHSWKLSSVCCIQHFEIISAL